MKKRAKNRRFRSQDQRNRFPQNHNLSYSHLDNKSLKNENNEYGNIIKQSNTKNMLNIEVDRQRNKFRLTNYFNSNHINTEKLIDTYFGLNEIDSEDLEIDRKKKIK